MSLKFITRIKKHTLERQETSKYRFKAIKFRDSRHKNSTIGFNIIFKI